MAVALRLKRCGSRGRPTYRVVAIDDRKKRDGREIENLGSYNPLVEPPTVQLNEARVQYWLGQGAQASNTVRKLIQPKKSAALQTPA